MYQIQHQIHDVMRLTRPPVRICAAQAGLVNSSAMIVFAFPDLLVSPVYCNMISFACLLDVCAVLTPDSLVKFPQKNPMAVAKYASDPEVMSLVQQVQKILRS